MAQYTGEPQVGDAHAGDGFQRSIIHPVEGAAAILLARAPGHAVFGGVGKVADKELVDDGPHISGYATTAPLLHSSRK